MRPSGTIIHHFMHSPSIASLRSQLQAGQAAPRLHALLIGH